MARDSRSPRAHPDRVLRRPGDHVRAGGPRRLLDPHPRARPAGRHPDHADRRGLAQRGEPRRGGRDHRPAGQRLRRLGGRGHHPGQRVRHRRDPRHQPARPGRDGRAAGAAAVPPGRVQLGRPALRWRSHAHPARPDDAPRRHAERPERPGGARGHRHPEGRQEPAAGRLRPARPQPRVTVRRRHPLADRGTGRADPAGWRRPDRPAGVDRQPRPGLGPGLREVRVPAGG